MKYARVYHLDWSEMGPSDLAFCLMGGDAAECVTLRALEDGLVRCVALLGLEQRDLTRWPDPAEFCFAVTQHLDEPWPVAARPWLYATATGPVRSTSVGDVVELLPGRGGGENEVWMVDTLGFRRLDRKAVCA